MKLMKYLTKIRDYVSGDCLMKEDNGVSDSNLEKEAGSKKEPFMDQVARVQREVRPYKDYDINTSLSDVYFGN